MKIIVLVSITDHVVIAVFITTSSHYLFCIPFAFSKHLSWSCMILYLREGLKPSFLKDLAHY